MAEKSNIAWCYGTYNHWFGCEKVSPACKHCYAEETVTKRMKLPVWGAHAPRKLSSPSNQKLPYAWNRAAIKEGVKRRIFCSSLSDVFEDREELKPWRRDLFKMIEETQEGLVWMLLTKRADKMASLAKEAGWEGTWPENVWAGVTVENKPTAIERVAHLLTLPLHETKGVRFVSMEPLLSPVDLTCLPCPGFLDSTFPDYFDALGGTTYYSDGEFNGNINNLDWVIVGGESGPHSRSSDLEWALDLRNQVHNTRMRDPRFFFKQTGAKPLLGGAPYPISDKKGQIWSEWPEELREQSLPTKFNPKI